MDTKRIFLASSSELKEDRREFEIFISRINQEWLDNGVFLDLIIWENFLDAMAKTQLQDEYNKAIRECDIFIMLFFTKVGKYTRKEFETAFGQFKETSKPIIYTYFKDAEIRIGSITKDILSMLNFQERLKELNHFVTVYQNIQDLKLQFRDQLNILVKKGHIKFSQPVSDPSKKLIDVITKVIPSEDPNAKLVDRFKNFIKNKLKR